MSQPPPMYPQQPSPYSPDYSSMTPGAPVRPSSVTAAAILGIVMSSLGLLCNLFALVATVAQGAIRINSNQVQMPKWVMAVSAVGAVVSLAIMIAWLATSIGLLRVANWARSLAMKLAALHIAFLVLSTGVALILIAPETKKSVEAEMQRQQQSQPQGKAPPPAVMAGIAAGAAYAGPIIGFLFWMILPVTVLICLTRPSARMAFGQPSGPMQ